MIIIIYLNNNFFIKKYIVCRMVTYQGYLIALGLHQVLLVFSFPLSRVGMHTVFFSHK